MEDQGEEKQSFLRRNGWGIAGLAAVVALQLINPFGFIVQDEWSPETAATASRLLPFYVGGCAILAAALMAVVVKRFPKAVPMSTAAATLLVITGGLVQLKLIREAETQEVRLMEPGRMAGRISSLQGLRGAELETAARERMREIVTEWYGEEEGKQLFIKRELPAAPTRAEE